MNKQKETHLRLYIEGIHCAQCIFRLESLKEKNKFINHFKVNMGDHTAEVGLAPGSIPEELLTVIKNLGFKPHLIDSGWDNETKHMIQENRRLLMKVGVAGAAAANIMLLSIAVYGGSNADLTYLFHFISMILFLPVFFYSAQPFFINSWKAFKQKHPSIDLPIAVALVVGGGLSLWNLFKGQAHQVYFDSLSALVFLLLGSRYLLARTQQKYLSPALWQGFLLSPTARRWKGNLWETNGTNQTLPSEREDRNLFLQQLQAQSETISTNHISKGDCLLVFCDEKIPVDGKLLNPQAYINTALLTGESRPQKFHRGEVCFAGTQCTSPYMFIQVIAKSEETRIGQILAQMKNEFLNRSPLLALTDKAAQRFTLVVLTISFLFFFGYLWINPQEAINRTLALIVLACPCAIAFATPLAQSLSLQAGLRQGFLIKNAGSLEKLAHLKEIVFDKTGTLTKGEFELLQWHPQPPHQEILSAIYALESHSDHPIARAFTNNLQEFAQPQLKITQVVETLGKGISGIIKQNQIQNQNQNQSQSQNYQLEHQLEIVKSQQDLPVHLKDKTHLIINVVDILWDGHWVATAVLGDQLKKDAQQTWQTLKEKGFKCHILTGDRKENVISLQKQLHLTDDEIAMEQSPESKSQFIKNKSHVAMIGDGANDAIAMASATIGIAVKGSMETSLKSADIYLFQPGLSSLVDLLKLAQKSESVIRRNLVVSMIYNSFCGTAALMGYIHPLIAAILMPLNSTIVTTLSFLGTRTTTAKALT